jgi:hypothetical protein
MQTPDWTGGQTTIFSHSAEPRDAPRPHNSRSTRERWVAPIGKVGGTDWIIGKVGGTDWIAPIGFIDLLNGIA